MISAIEQAEREIDRDKEDLKRLKKRYPGYDFVLVDPKKSGPSQHQRTPKTEFTDLELAVLSVVDQAPEKEWTNRSVTELLRSKGISLPEKQEAAMNAVGYALAELSLAEKILRSHEGRGRDPHRYTSIHGGQKVPSTGSVSQ